MKVCYKYIYFGSFEHRNLLHAIISNILFVFLQNDPTLMQYRSDLITEAGRRLDKARMVRFDERTGYFASTDLGRISSHFYIKYDTVEVGGRESVGLLDSFSAWCYY